MAEKRDYKALFRRAAEIAGELPTPMQDAGFNRALDLILEDEQAASPVRQSSGREAKARSSAKTTGAKPSVKKSTGQPTFLKDLNLRPKGKRSLADLVEEKQPKNDHERKLLSVYYIEKVLDVPATVDHVYSCFRDRGWPVPSNLVNSLQVTASRKAWIDTSDMHDIRVAIRGENHVDYEMPQSASAQ